MSSSQQVIATEPREQSGVPTKKSWWRRFKDRCEVYEADYKRPHPTVEGFPVFTCKGTHVKAPLEVIESRKYVFRTMLSKLAIIGIVVYYNWWIGVPILLCYLIFTGYFFLSTMKM